MKLSNLKIAARLGLGFGFVLLLLVIVMIVGTKNMAIINDKLDRIYNVNNVRISLANDMMGSMSIISLEMRNLMLLKDAATRNEANKHIEDARQKYAAALKQIKELDQTEEGQKLLVKVEEALGKAQSANNKVIELGMANKSTEALPIVVNESGPAMAKVDKALQELVKYQEGRNDFRYEEANKTYASSRKIMFLFSGFAIVLGIIISFFLTRSISNPVAELVKVANVASSGDLTAEIQLNSRDEIGKLAKAFKEMISQMRELVSQIIEKSNTVSSASQQLSANSEQTSASANETAATMTQIATMVDQVNSNTQEVSVTSEIANKHANVGNRGIVRVTEQMQAITLSAQESANVIDGLSRKSEEIKQIVELITNIADQTNLLALNAAIEAARAGEHGRGFTVVAEEVRKLAEQSASAAKEIKNLIGAIQLESQRAVESTTAGRKEVEAGSVVVQEVGEAFKEIISAVEGLTSQIQEVASATEQMSSGVQSVAATTEEQTSAMEEVSASAESLTKLAFELNSLVGKFRV